MAVRIKPVVFFLVSAFALSLVSSSSSVPFVVLYGLGESCSHSGISEFTQSLSNWSSTDGYCIEIGDGSWDSWVMPLMQQVDIACNKVKNIDALSDGYNIVGLSQGNMVGRGLIEFCDGGPSVNKFISLAGPHAGIASCPYCDSELICTIVDYLMELEVYTSLVQKHLAPSNYIKITTDLETYLKGCKYLPKLNNEIEETRNDTYKERFSSLEKLVLVMFENDTVLVPKETSWFGYYENGSMSTILSYNETELYTEDWIGLKTLNEAGKVEFISVSGGHLAITQSLMENYIVPYLVEDESYRVTTNTPTSRSFSSLFNSFFHMFM